MTIQLDDPGMAYPITGGHDARDRLRYRLFSKASVRVERSPSMRPLRNIIFGDWPNWEEHLQWVIKARVAEIVLWAKQIQRDCEGCGNGSN